MSKTFAERCHIAQQFLPDAQYKAMLTALHTEMLAALAEQPAQQEPVTLPEGKKLILVDGSFDDLMYWLERCEEKGHLENCPDLVEPLQNFSYKAYTTPQAQPAREWVNLADDELDDLTAIYSGMPLYRAIEAKLRVKNHD